MSLKLKIVIDCKGISCDIGWYPVVGLIRINVHAFTTLRPIKQKLPLLSRGKRHMIGGQSKSLSEGPFRGRGR